MKRFITCILCVTALLTALAGCGKNNGGGSDTSDPADVTKKEVTLRVWGAQDDQAMIREMCEAFAAANPDNRYTFAYGVVGEGEAKKMFLDDPDAAADVFHFANDQLADLVAAGALAQIGGSYRDTVEKENGEGSVEASMVNGKLYAFPATADNGYFLYYNKEFFPEAPDTLDDILAVCTPERKFAMKLSDGWYNASFFLTAGCDFSEEKTIDWNSDAGLAAARAMNALAKDARYVNFGADYDPSVVSGFGDGSVIAAVSGTWNAEKIANEIGEDKLGAAKLPKIRIDGTETQMRGFAGYKLVGVNASSRQPGEAVKLAAWLTNEENQMKRFTERAMGPSNKKAAASEAVQKNIALAALSEQLQYSASQSNVPASFWVAAEGFGTDLVSGSVADDALAGMLDTLVKTVNNPVA